MHLKFNHLIFLKLSPSTVTERQRGEPALRNDFSRPTRRKLIFSVAPKRRRVHFYRKANLSQNRELVK